MSSLFQFSSSCLSLAWVKTISHQSVRIALYFHFQVFQVKWFLASNSSNGLKAFHIIFNCHYYFLSPTLATLNILHATQTVMLENIWMSLFSYIILGILGTSYRFAFRLVDEIGIFSVIKFTAFTVHFLMTFSISISYGVTYSQFLFDVPQKILIFLYVLI